jgi:hypothetical protein
VVNRMDELRKRIQLAQPLGATRRYSGPAPPSTRHASSAWPATRSASWETAGTPPPTSTRTVGGDGFGEFRSAFETLRPKLVANAVDVTVLHGGRARLDILAERVEQEGDELCEGWRGSGELQADVSESLQEGQRSRLERLVVDFLDGLIHSNLHDRDRDRRAALERRIARWTDDRELAQLTAAWHHGGTPANGAPRSPPAGSPRPLPSVRQRASLAAGSSNRT